MLTLTLEEIAKNPWITIISFILTILSIIFAIIFYIRSQRDKTPCYEHHINTIIEGLHQSLDGLEVIYKGLIQDRISVSKIIFWNEGKETIDKNDLISRDPLRLVCPSEIDVLDIQLINNDGKSNSVEIGPPTAIEDKTYFPISFEYLDHKDYFIIQIIHNGNSNTELFFDGKIKGVNDIKSTVGLRTPYKFNPLIPLVSNIDKLISSSFFMKYFGGSTYLLASVFLIANIIMGNNNWYMWLGACFCTFSSLVIYYSFRYVPPVKI